MVEAEEYNNIIISVLGYVLNVLTNIIISIFCNFSSAVNNGLT